MHTYIYSRKPQIYVYLYVHIYIYVYTHRVCIHIYIYIFTCTYHKDGKIHRTPAARTPASQLGGPRRGALRSGMERLQELVACSGTQRAQYPLVKEYEWLSKSCSLLGPLNARCRIIFKTKKGHNFDNRTYTLNDVGIWYITQWRSIGLSGRYHV